jgi:hypothetical protein
MIIINKRIAEIEAQCPIQMQLEWACAWMPETNRMMV